MKTISHQEFLNFIFSQPRDRKINMQENVADDSQCGCMMIHLARNKGLSGLLCAGYQGIGHSDGENEIILDRNIITYFPHEKNGFDISTTYGDVQDYLIQKGKKIPENNS